MHEIASVKGTVFSNGGDFHPLLGMLKATRMNGQRNAPMDSACKGIWATDNDLFIASILLDVGIVSVEVGTDVESINTETLPLLNWML